MVDFETTDPFEDSDLNFETFNRSIDLLENKALKNPFSRKSIDNSKFLFMENEVMAWLKDIKQVHYRNQFIYTRD